jgi:hypothetical protein
MIILGKTYKVNHVEGLYEDDSSIGKYNGQKNVLELDANTTKDNKEESLFHEVVHAISADCALELTEAQVSTLSCVLYATIKNNWKLKIDLEE